MSRCPAELSRLRNASLNDLGGIAVDTMRKKSFEDSVQREAGAMISDLETQWHIIMFFVLETECLLEFQIRKDPAGLTSHHRRKNRRAGALFPDGSFGPVAAANWGVIVELLLTCRR